MYSKWVEAAGGRVVPIHVNRDEQYYKDLLPQLNGVLLPGGKQDISNCSFTTASQIIFNYAIEAKKRGEIFPVWGTCQGFEVLVYLIAGYDPLTLTKAVDMPAPIVFEKEFKNYKTLVKGTRLFKSLDKRTYNAMKTTESTIHYHNFGLTKQNFTKIHSLKNFFRIISSNPDENGLENISIIEGKEYPFYATIFHPEVAQFSFVNRPAHERIPHNKEAIQTAQYFANFFVNECKKNLNGLREETKKSLLHHYNPEDTDQPHLVNDQVYFFPLK